MVLHYVYSTLWMVQLAGMVLQTGVLMGIYMPAERWKREYQEIKEEPFLTYTELKPPSILEQRVNFQIARAPEFIFPFHLRPLAHIFHSQSSLAN